MRRSVRRAFALAQRDGHGFGDEFGPVGRPPRGQVGHRERLVEDVVAGLTEAVRRGRVRIVTREADAVCYLQAGPEIAVASTKAFVTQVLVLQMLALQLA